MKFLIRFMLIASINLLLHSTVAKPIEFRSLGSIVEERLAELGDSQSKLTPKIRPNWIQISIRSFRDNEQTPDDQVTNLSTQRQIPVISDIERIKKVVEILEFVGEKVGAILENLPSPAALAQPDVSSEGRFAKNNTNVDVVTEAAPESTSIA